MPMIAELVRKAVPPPLAGALPQPGTSPSDPDAGPANGEPSAKRRKRDGRANKRKTPETPQPAQAVEMG